jgi:flagellar hook assembly protein FlgD
LPPDDFWISRNVYRPGYDEPAVYAKVRLSNDGVYSLKVYNSAGELVKVLRDQQIVGGAYEDVSWDGTNKFNEPAASGVYIIYYTTRYKTQMAKLLIVR